MYLYERDKNIIRVYSIVPNKTKIYNFRKKEIEGMNFENKVLKVNFNELKTDITFRSSDRINYIPYESIKLTKLKGTLINNSTNKEVTEDEIIEKYYETGLNEVFQGNKIFNLVGYNDKKSLEILKYLILGTNEYKIKKSASDLIIPVTKNLYLLEILLKYVKSENKSLYDELECESIDKQIKLFDISRVPEFDFDFDEIRKFEKTMILGAQLNIQKKLNKSIRFLKSIKK